jgi:ergothioneine biosynthesis protein EgtB
MTLASTGKQQHIRPESEAREALMALYAQTRARTESLAARLSPEDQVLQSMPDASPAKWHRAHATWFFETFVLCPAGIEVFDPSFGYLFNSYYDAVGPRHERPKRGLLSRPSADEVGAYRRAVDERMAELLSKADDRALGLMRPVIQLGIAHEEQHQELLLTDILHAFAQNPLRPAFLSAPQRASASPSQAHAGAPSFVTFEGGLQWVGASHEGFAFDNERPRHREWIEPFALAHRPVSVGEVKAFIREGGYQTPSLWLSEGFDFVRANGVRAPLHASEEGDGDFRLFTLGGERIATDDEPAAHVSYYEADAIARFLGGRLPTEAEWELAASQCPVEGNFLDDGALRPLPATTAAAGTAGTAGTSLGQMFGDVWEWTRSSYAPYPGYAPSAGALGEYNGKFMVGQQVLRGGSCLTPRRHVRPSYRNFWQPATRFQMAGLRLAKDACS